MCVYVLCVMWWSDIIPSPGELVVRGTAIRPPPGGMSKADPGQDVREGERRGRGGVVQCVLLSSLLRCSSPYSVCV